MASHVWCVRETAHQGRPRLVRAFLHLIYLMLVHGGPRILFRLLRARVCIGGRVWAIAVVRG